MMGAFGRFLELSVPAPDILQSLGFYRSLGFVELPAGDIRPWHYAVVTDGRIAIGLHAAGIDEPALAFVRPNLASQVRALEDAGHEFDMRRLGPDEFHEAALRGPDGHRVLMMEARTFSPGGDSPATPPIVGTCVEVTLACRSRDATRGFFEAAGFLPADEQGSEVVKLHTPGVLLGLREAPRSAAAVLRFAATDGEHRRAALAALDLLPVNRPEGEVLLAPEGTRLVLAP